MKKALIISGTSAIGSEFIRLLLKDSVSVVATGRNEKKLLDLKQKFPQIQTFILDVKTNPEKVFQSNEDILREVDFVLICTGTGEINRNFDTIIDKEMIGVNIEGCVEILLHFIRVFEKQGKGHIAVITSLAGITSSADSACYNASKAFLSNYICGLRKQLKKKKSNVVLTDIKPGLVNTPMAKGEGLFWVSPVSKATKQIYTQILNKKNMIIVTKRWKMLYYLYKIFT